MGIPSYLYSFLFSLLLFCGPNLVGAMGVDIKYFYSLIMLICSPLILLNRKILVKEKNQLRLLLFCLIYGFLFIYFDRSEGSRYTGLVIMLTPFLFSVFPNNSSCFGNNIQIIKMYNRFLNIFICFFVIETMMAAVERITGFNILGYQLTEGEAVMEFSSGFRSTSLHGHPLCNALIVSTSMAFILTSQIRMKIKLVLWMLGFFSILCFNTRSSIVGNAILLAVFTIYTLCKGHDVSPKDKRLLVSMVVFMALVGSVLFFVMGFGSRLAEMGLFDDSSAMARVDVFNIFEYYPLEDFLWGMDYTQYEYAMYYAGIEIVENFYIAYILRNGIVFLVVYILLYVCLIKRLYRGYDWFTKWFTGGAFILIASTNNSLSTLSIALFLFLILIVIFNPTRKNNIMQSF